MIDLIKKYHLVTNFPKNYPVYKRFIVNFVFFLSGIITSKRKNKLSHKDLFMARLLLRRGDIVLVGNSKSIFSEIINEPVTHSAVYVGRKRFIHSIRYGVGYVSLHNIFTRYDTLVILRLPRNVKRRWRVIRKAIRYMKTQYGKPFDFDLRRNTKSFFCTQLVNEAFKYAGYKTKLISVKRSKGVIKEIERIFGGIISALHPNSFLKGNFDVVFLSHNLKIKNKNLVFVGD